MFGANTEHYKEEVLFRVNYRANLTTEHVVRFMGGMYDITRVDVFEGYRGDLVICCKRRV